MSNEPTMTPHDDDDMQPEYDFSHGVRGKHANAMRQGYTVTVHKLDGTTEERDVTLPKGVIALDPDVQAYFPDSETVNRALRSLIDLIPRQKAS
jgi:hypothetical protein